MGHSRPDWPFRIMEENTDSFKEPPALQSLRGTLNQIRRENGSQCSFQQDGSAAAAAHWTGDSKAGVTMGTSQTGPLLAQHPPWTSKRKAGSRRVSDRCPGAQETMPALQVNHRPRVKARSGGHPATPSATCSKECANPLPQPDAPEEHQGDDDTEKQPWEALAFSPPSCPSLSSGGQPRGQVRPETGVSPWARFSPPSGLVYYGWHDTQRSEVFLASYMQITERRSSLKHRTDNLPRCCRAGQPHRHSLRPQAQAQSGSHRFLLSRFRKVKGP